jgi:hypothetical protein
MNDEQQLAEGVAANDSYVQEHYPDDKFISVIPWQITVINKYVKGLLIPENVKVAESRLPINTVQREILRKELLQAEVLAKLGNSIYFTPERGLYKIRVTDALVNGVAYEFRYITGKSRQVEIEFSNAKKKGKNANVFLNIDSDISKNEVRRRIGLVLGRHSDYVGKIVVSWMLGSPDFWDTSDFR